MNKAATLRQPQGALKGGGSFLMRFLERFQSPLDMPS